MPRILIVDDAKIDRLLARRLLEKNPEFIIAQAEDGAVALAQMEELVPDAVVTDLQMPNVDGLVLVETIRRKYPYVPVVLMTAHGSEDVAARALMAGAASYVPKVDLPQYLLDTVEHVLAAARTHRPSHDLLACLEARYFEFQVENDCRLIPPLVDQLQLASTQIGLIDELGRVPFALALEESLLYALLRGNLEISAADAEEFRSALVTRGEDKLAERARQPPYQGRRLSVTATITREEARFVIRHQGLPLAWPEWNDHTIVGQMNQLFERGWTLIGLRMDEVQRDESGQEIRLIKRRKFLASERNR